MNYTDPNSRETDAALSVEEPAVAFYTPKVGNAIAEPYKAEWDDYSDTDDDDDGYPGAPESVTVHSYEELCQKLEEARIAREAGLVRPIDDFWRDFKRKIANGEL